MPVDVYTATYSPVIVGVIIGVIFVALTVIAASLYVVARQREQARAAG